MKDGRSIEERAMRPQQRVDLFSLIHKGLRKLLFETAMEVSAIDFVLDDGIERAEQAIRGCFAFLREHAEHEDRAIEPWIARFSPEVAAALAAEHIALEKAAIGVESLLPRLAGAGAGLRLEMGAELQRRLHLLVADQLRHLEREEREANAVLWANLPDQNLSEIRSGITSRIGPARLSEWDELLGRALNGRERAALVGSTTTR
jgi:hypothetical protein